MKVFLFFSLFVMSFASYAQTYCYDRGMASIMQMKTMISDCDVTMDLSVWSNMEEKLLSTNPVRYKAKALAALRLVDEQVATWPEQNFCLVEAKRRYELFHRLKIQESISWCSSLI